MNSIKLALAALAVGSLLIVGCSKSESGGGGDDATKMSKEQLGERMAGMMDSMATAVDSNKEDCDKMATAVTKVVDSNKAFMTSAKSLEEKQSEADKKWFEEKYADRMKAAEEKMMGGMMKCATNEKLQAAMKSMGN